MDAGAAPAPDFEATLAELAGLGMRAVRVVTSTLEVEQAVIAIVATSLPNKDKSGPASPGWSVSDAIAAAEGIDSVSAALAAAVPRIDTLSRAHDRLSRSLRRTVALHRRLQTGWTGAKSWDNRAATQTRPADNGAGEKTPRDADKEAAEDLFAELDEELDDPGLDADIAAGSVEEVVARICRDISLAAHACAPLLQPRSPHPHSECGTAPPDTG
jgi:hypothetical protein